MYYIYSLYELSIFSHSLDITYSESKKYSYKEIFNKKSLIHK